ncbi:hypothetical protein [Pseudonocardia sp.]|uniref:hypothetical protein n=1 Tax=Pseudonocardia sp. TaxID=60912 RepID=UPI003D116D87
MSTTVELSQRDVVFTPFMLRVRAAGEVGREERPRVRPSTLHPIAEATDEWFYLRCRAEQVIAEANAMLPDGPLHLQDEYGTGQLAFVLRCRDRSARIWLSQVDRKGWVELDRSYQHSSSPVAPADEATIEDLVVELLEQNVELLEQNVELLEQNVELLEQNTEETSNG